MGRATPLATQVNTLYDSSSAVHKGVGAVTTGITWPAKNAHFHIYHSLWIATVHTNAQFSQSNIFPSPMGKLKQDILKTTDQFIHDPQMIIHNHFADFVTFCHCQTSHLTNSLVHVQYTVSQNPTILIVLKYASLSPMDEFECFWGWNRWRISSAGSKFQQHSYC